MCQADEPLFQGQCSDWARSLTGAAHQLSDMRPRPLRLLIPRAE